MTLEEIIQIIRNNADDSNLSFIDELDEIKQMINYPVSNSDSLEAYRLKYLAQKSGLTNKLFDEFALFIKEKKLDDSQRKQVGYVLKLIKQKAELKYEESKKYLNKNSEKQVAADLTLPGRTFSVGHEHILIQTLNDFVKIFREIGFKVAEGPEIEEELYNFDALNTPAHHPSRDIQDTFYVNKTGAEEKQYLLRTHTSPVQIRTMMSNQPPIRIVSPGKVFRNETVTVKNYFMFHQVEGLYVDKNVSMRDLKGALSYFVRRFYGRDIQTRFRPSFFPFTEPSAELDITCFICKGKGCKTCKNTGWIELGGCGMVDPNVFKAVGYDPDVYSGYAFGMGIERIAMMKYGINDIRLFYQNDVRFLDQF